MTPSASGAPGFGPILATVLGASGNGRFFSATPVTVQLVGILGIAAYQRPS